MLDFGIATESGLEGTYSSVVIDMVSSSSASQPVEDNTDGGQNEEFLEVEVETENSDDGFRTTITFRKNDLRRPPLDVTL